MMSLPVWPHVLSREVLPTEVCVRSELHTMEGVLPTMGCVLPTMGVCTAYYRV